MEVNANAAYAIYPENVVLTEVLQKLGRGGVDKESICMILSPTHPISTIVRESSTRRFERESNAVTAGLIGWLSEFGAVLIPKFGFFIRSREFFHTLFVERDSAPGCGPTGTLLRLGFAPREAERFDSQVRDLGVFLFVSCRESERMEWALELLRATGAQEAGTLQSETAAAVA